MVNLSKIQRYALYLYFFSLNFEFFNLFGLGSTSRLTGLIYLISILPSHRYFLKTSLIKYFLAPWFIFWFYLAFISFININEISYHVFDVTLLLNIFYFWFLLNHERREPRILLKGFLFFALSGVLLTLFYLLGIGLEYDGERVKIFGDNQNAIGFRLSLSAIILIYLSITKKLFTRFWRYFLLLPIPFILTFMIETGSRKAFIGFSLSFLIFVVLLKTNKLWKKIIFFLFSSIFIGYVINKFMGSAILSERLNNTVEDGDLAGRDRIWSAIIPYIEDNIVFGGGITGFTKYSTKTFGAYNNPHNVFIEVAAYTGLLGLIIYIYFLFKVFKQSYIAYRKQNFLLPFLLLIPIMGLILGGQALTTKIVWCVYAFAIISVFYTGKKTR